MDADLSHNPDDVPRLLEALRRADLVIGSRYCQGISIVNWPLRRLLLSLAANQYARTLLGTSVRDVTSGFRAWRAKALVGLSYGSISARGYGFLISLTALAKRAGLTTLEIPIVFTERRLGSSKLGLRIMIESFVNTLLLGLFKTK